MPDSKPKRRKKSDRPNKPYKDFPLTPHASGAWQKKIRGKIYYFGRWGQIRKGKMERLPGDGWEDALKLYKAQADDLHAGRNPRHAKNDDLTLKELCNAFLNAKLLQMQSGDLTAVTFGEYRQITDRIISSFGKSRVAKYLGAKDFEELRAELADQYGPVRLGNSVQRVRTVFKYGYEAGLLDNPIRFGPQFKKPSARILRKQRNESAKRLYSPIEIKWLLDGKAIVDEQGKKQHLAGASLQMRAMILLGINCGFGNSDIANLPISTIDFDRGWVDFPRPKTEIARRCPLWPETVEALKLALTKRPDPINAADADCMFITAYGNRWVREGTNAIGLQFGKILRRLSINGRKGLGFYSLRHTFRTIADATKDFPAVRLIMGHVDASIDAVYREQIDDERLMNVTSHLHHWLFQKKTS